MRALFFLFVFFVSFFSFSQKKYSKTIKNIDSRLKRLVESCIKDGLLMVYTGRESIKLGPPLTISKDAIKAATKIIKKNILKTFND